MVKRAQSKKSSPLDQLGVGNPLIATPDFQKAYKAWWEDKEKRILEAFEKLPRPAENPLLYPVLAAGIPHDILSANPVRSTPEIIAHSRRYKSASRSASVKELEAVKIAADNLLERISEMHAPAIAAIGKNFKPGWFDGVLLNLKILRIGAEFAPGDILDVSPNAGKGRPRKDGVARLAKKVAFHYVYVTGKKPTVRVKDGIAYGPYLQLIADIFAILEVNEAPEFYARKAKDEIIAELWRKTPS